MTELCVIGQLDVTHEGPVALDPDCNEQHVHLRQGDLDGACGPYCLLMCLLICGVAYRDELISLEQIDGRTNAGKILNMLAEYSGFFRGGTAWSDLCSMLEKSFPRKLDFDIAAVTGAELKPFIEGHVNKSHPVILSVRWNKGAHWVVVVGLEYEKENGQRKLARLLILDPSNPPSDVSAWNGVVDARKGQPGIYPFNWWSGGEQFVQMEDCFAVWKK